MKNALLICDPQNTWVGTYLKRTNGFFKKDGLEFQRQMKIAASYYENDGYNVTDYELSGNNAFRKRINLYSFLGMIYGKRFDRIEFFMHGHPRALNRGMVKQGVNLHILADLISEIVASDCKIVLWSCKTGKLDDGFAAELCQLTQCDVMAHTTSGHTTRNPYKRLFHLWDAPCFMTVENEELWPKHGGIRALKKRLRKTIRAPFEFVEEVFMK